MKLSESIKLVGNPVVVSDSSRDELPELFREMGYKIGAEIGVLKGKFTEKYCQAGLKMYAVDPWMSYEGSGRTQQVQKTQDDGYEETKERLIKYPDCTLIRKISMDAIADFKDGSLDFVYIDGNHAFRYVAEDIYEWSKKVRSGGIVAGHDYFNTPPSARNLVCQVKAVVDAYINLYEIENWWLYGKKVDATNADDKVYSWMWIKP